MKLLVIGGGAAGMSAASKARRMDKNAEITVFEKGNFVSYAECGMPYFLSGYFNKMTDLLHYPISEFIVKRNIKVMTGTEINSINRSEKYITAGDKKYYYDRLVIATGAVPKVPENFAGNVFTLRDMNDVAKLKNVLEGADHITIIGAGVLGTELFSLLSKKYKVKLISKHEYVLPYLDNDMGSSLKDILNNNNADIEYNSVPLEISRTGNKFQTSTAYGKYTSDVAIFAGGIKPSTELAVNSGINVKNNLIEVNDYMQTSDEDIYAGGDNVAAKNIVSGEYGFYPLAQIANKMGRTIGTNITGNKRTFPGVLGTTIINVSGWQVGYTGINEANAKRLNYNFDSVFIKAKSRSNYLKGNDVYIKIIFRKEDKKLLGAQIIDMDNGAWRLNTLASMISAGMDLYHIVYSDLGYEPEYGPVWDPIIIAASVGLDR